MSELSEIAAELEAAGKRGETVVLATVVRTEGSVYRRMGARMLVRADNTTVGAVSGGCLEADIVARVQSVRASGSPLIVTYDTRSSEDIVWGLGLGCQGVVEVLLKPLTGEELWMAVTVYQICAGTEFPMLLATVIRSEANVPRVGDLFFREHGSFQALQFDMGFSQEAARHGETQADILCRLQTDSEEMLSGGRSLVRTYRAWNGIHYDIAYEVVTPPISLLICGAGHDAVPVARLACELGWRVTVADHRAAYARPEHFPGATVLTMREVTELGEVHIANARTAVVVMAHHYERDRAALALLLDADTPYIGMLGPRRRTEQMLGELADAGRVITPEQRARIFGPVGLDLGSETPAEIALAIVSEVQAVMRGRSGASLRAVAGPIHSPTPLETSEGASSRKEQGDTLNSVLAEPVCAITQQP